MCGLGPRREFIIFLKLAMTNFSNFDVYKVKITHARHVITLGLLIFVTTLKYGNLYVYDVY